MFCETIYQTLQLRILALGIFELPSKLQIDSIAWAKKVYGLW